MPAVCTWVLMKPGETSLPRAAILASAVPVYAAPACTTRSPSNTTLPRSCTSWLLPLNATTQPPSMSVLMASSPSDPESFEARFCLRRGIGECVWVSSVPRGELRRRGAAGRTPRLRHLLGVRRHGSRLHPASPRRARARDRDEHRGGSRPAGRHGARRRKHGYLARRAARSCPSAERWWTGARVSPARARRSGRSEARPTEDDCSRTSSAFLHDPVHALAEFKKLRAARHVRAKDVDAFCSSLCRRYSSGCRFRYSSK